MKRYGKLERQLRENWVWFPEVGPISAGILLGGFQGKNGPTKRKDNITETVKEASLHIYIYIYIFTTVYIQLNCIVCISYCLYVAKESKLNCTAV